LIGILAVISCKESEEATANEKTQTTDVSFDSITFEKIWETDTLMTTSESVIYDSKREMLYVACINGISPWVHDGDGFIARVNLQGEVIDHKWVEGMSAPKGMGILEDMLYVNDINQILKIDLETGEISERIPVEGAERLNDLTVAHDGDIFVSDSKASVIYKITDGVPTKILQDSTLNGINGIYMFHDTLFFATYNEGAVYRIQHDDLVPKKLVNLPSGGDGVEMYKDGFIISAWEGRIFLVDNNWKFREFLNSTQQKINSADIEVIEDKDLLLVPTFFDNRVVAYKIKY